MGDYERKEWCDAADDTDFVVVHGARAYVYGMSRDVSTIAAHHRTITTHFPPKERKPSTFAQTQQNLICALGARDAISTRLTFFDGYKT